MLAEESDPAVSCVYHYVTLLLQNITSIIGLTTHVQRPQRPHLLRLADIITNGGGMPEREAEQGNNYISPLAIIINNTGIVYTGAVRDD